MHIPKHKHISTDTLHRWDLSLIEFAIKTICVDEQIESSEIKLFKKYTKSILDKISNQYLNIAELLIDVGNNTEE